MSQACAVYSPRWNCGRAPVYHVEKIRVEKTRLNLARSQPANMNTAAIGTKMIFIKDPTLLQEFYNDSV